MGKPLVLALGIVLLAPTLTGCLGSGGEDASEDGLETQSRAEVTSGTGGIEGVVTDEAVQAVEGATVEVRELSQSTETKEDGSFAFSNVQPGTYTLEVDKDGFIGTEEPVEVASSRVAAIEIVLAHEPTAEPYTQQFQFKGFLECSVRAVVGVAVCSIPNTALGGNATNDRFLFTHSMEPNAWQMFSEMQWEPNQALSERMSLIVEPDGIANDDDVTFAEEEAASPIVMNTDRQRFFEVEDNLTATCEEEDATGSNEAYCNRNYVEEGGSLQLRVFVEGINEVTVPENPCPADVPCLGGSYNTVGLALQQEFTVFNTIFYNAPACEEFSVAEDNQCEQQDTPPENDPYNGTSEGNGTSGNRIR